VFRVLQVFGAVLVFSSCDCGGPIVPPPMQLQPLTVDPTNVDFGTLVVGQSATRTIHLTNANQAAVQVLWQSPDSPFSVGGESSSVAAGITSLTATAISAVVGDFSSTLAVNERGTTQVCRLHVVFVAGSPTDAGTDAGATDAGLDGGEVDAGFDAGIDAGAIDAGADGGSADASVPDAGPPPACLAFAGRSPYPTGVGPFSVAAGDITGDGKPDLVAANTNAGTLTVLANTGMGQFVVAQTLNGGAAPIAIALGDFDRNGWVDVAVAAQQGGGAAVSLNDAGTLLEGILFPSGAEPNAITAADLDHDGLTDLLLANFADNSVSVLRGDATMLFASPVPYTAGGGPNSIALGDLSGDGLPDVAIADFANGQNLFSVLDGMANATFQPGAMVQALQRPISVAIGDLDADGNPDVVTANYKSGDVSWFRNLGAATFASPVSTGVGNQPSFVGAADLDNDGHLELIVAVTGSNAVLILGLQNGQLVQRLMLGTGHAPTTVIAADLNADGHLDLVTSDHDDNAVSVFLSTCP
jgi:hypothetical protein